MTKKRLLTYIIMVLSLLMTIKLAKDIYWLWHTEDRLTKANKELAEAKKEQQGLKQALEEVESSQWWEKQIRDKLMMARPEETVVIVPEAIASRAAERQTGEEGTGKEADLKPWQKWWQLFMVK
jgi:cell division protein FtsB